jgi:multidrug efflux pump subunit AcrA (membrane-fusion protein)
MLRVPEAQIYLVREGQTTQVRVDAFPNERLEGKVKQVATTASPPEWAASDVKVYAVTVALPDALGIGLKPGMTAEARIDTGGKKGVLHVPASAVLRLGRDAVCLVKEGQGLVRRPVAVGALGEQGIEIRSGLKEGDEVLRDPDAVLRRLGVEK